MSNIRREKTHVSQLAIGMFVCDLDRPWLGTPFLLEGLLIEEEAQLETLQGLCEFVYVDHTVSVSNYFIAPSKEDVAIKRDSAIVRLHTPPPIKVKQSQDHKKTPVKQSVQAATTPASRFSFFEVLKEINQTNQSVRDTSSPDGSPDSNQTSRPQQTIPKLDNTYEDLKNPVSNRLSSQIKADLAHLISGLTGWGSKVEKLGSAIDKAAVQGL